MSYTVEAVANALIKRAKVEGKHLTPLQLQKLVYLCQGVALGAYGIDKPLFSEQVEAWQYGPVVPRLYQQIKRYGKEPIKDTLWPYSRSLHGIVRGKEKPNIPLEDKQSWDVIEGVWEQYGKLSPSQLVALTHRESRPEGYPWHHTWYKLGGSNREHTDIPLDVIHNKFSQFVRATP